jgi:S1-C subfamily serine protease
MAALVALGLASTMFNTARAADLQTIANATYKLYEGERGGCSVTFLKNDPNGALFLTAAHCVDGNVNMNVREQVIDQTDLKTVLSEQVYYAKAIRTLNKNDVAILQLRDKDVKIAKATGIDIATPEEAQVALAIGTPLIAVGYPAAENLAIVRGEYSSRIPSPFAGRSAAPFAHEPMYQTTVRVAGGMSGGGLYAEIYGTWKLVGTTTARRLDNEVMTYFQTADTVNKILQGFVQIVAADKADSPAKPVIEQKNTVNPGVGIDLR